MTQEKGIGMAKKRAVKAKKGAAKVKKKVNSATKLPTIEEMLAAGRPDGRRVSPVVRANCCFYGEFSCIDVRFQNVEQLDELIAALVELRRFPADGFDHVHLQHTKLFGKNQHPAGVEVTFWHPSVKRDTTDRSLVATAAKAIEEYEELTRCNEPKSRL